MGKSGHHEKQTVASELLDKVSDVENVALTDNLDIRRPLCSKISKVFRKREYRLAKLLESHFLSSLSFSLPPLFLHFFPSLKKTYYHIHLTRLLVYIVKHTLLVNI